MDTAIQVPNGKRVGLLLTGFQKDYFDSDGVLGLSGRDIAPLNEIRPATLALLSTVRALQIPVIHAREVALLDGRSDSEAWLQQRRRSGLQTPIGVHDSLGQRFLDELQPIAGELVIERFRPSCFSDTRTQVLLRSNGVGGLVVVGVETHMSVLSTVLEAVCLDYHVAVAQDCVADTSSELHQASMTVLRSWAECDDSQKIARRLTELAGE